MAQVFNLCVFQYRNMHRLKACATYGISCNKSPVVIDWYIGDGNFIERLVDMTDWEKIVARHSGIVWRTAYRLLGDCAEADDCFQDAFVAALAVSRRQRVRNWPGLLRKLATCKALDRLRSRFRRAARSDESADWAAVASPNPGPAQQAAAAELSERLRCALAALPDGQAEVFSLRYVGNLKYRQIARLLGLKASAVGVLLHRARSRLRELLSPGNEVKGEGVSL